MIARNIRNPPTVPIPTDDAGSVGHIPRPQSGSTPMPSIARFSVTHVMIAIVNRRSQPRSRSTPVSPASNCPLNSSKMAHPAIPITKVMKAHV